jgi:hypothetical protein
MSSYRIDIAIVQIVGAGWLSRCPTRVFAMGTKGSTASLGEASVEYRLLRDSIARAVRSGKVAREDVCDAHPELVRAGSNIGRPTGEACPVCDAAQTYEVTYVFGAKLPPGGTCPTTKTELTRLLRREEPVQAYSVEVCTECRFHHLLRRYPGGADQKAATTRRSAR